MTYGIPSSTRSPVFNPWQSRFVGEFPFVEDVGTIAAGQVLTAGAVLGVITATGQYVKSVKTAADGSQVPVALLTSDTDATAGATLCGVYLFGNFSDTFIANGVLDASWTLATIKTAFRAVGIFITTVLQSE